MTIPRYKRVPIDWELLKKRIKEEGYTLSSIAQKIDINKQILYNANRDHKLNPAIVYEISKHIFLDIRAILGGVRIERIYNGRSTSGRVGTDWLYLKRECERKNYSLKKLSAELGKSESYLGSCKREGGISEDVLMQIGEILNIDYHNLIKVTSYEKWNLRNEIVGMVNDHNYPDSTRNMQKEINSIYQGTSTYWLRLKTVMTGEVGNYINRDSDEVKEDDYDLAAKYKPDLESFSMCDVMKCECIIDLPAKWKDLAFACMKKYGLPPFTEHC